MRSVVFVFLLGVVSSATAQVIDSLALSGTQFDIDLYGTVYVIDESSNLLTVYPEGAREPVRRIGGQGWGNEQFDHPSGIWARNGMDIFVADHGNHRVQRFDRTISFVNSLSTREDEDPKKRFGWPSDVALSRLGDLFICDTENDRILKVRRSTQAEISFGGFDAGKGRLAKPEQVEVGARDNIYVLDRSGILIFDVFGNYLRHLGEGLFTKPTGVFADEGRVVVLDGDFLYRFDEHERPSPPVSLASLSGGRLSGADVRSFAVAKGVLIVLTQKGLYRVQLPPVNPEIRRKAE